MKITITLSAEERIAMRRFMNEIGLSAPEPAIRLALRDWLIGSGYLELPHELDEDTETMGET